jgi:hypothetical protein
MHPAIRYFTWQVVDAKIGSECSNPPCLPLWEVSSPNESVTIHSRHRGSIRSKVVLVPCTTRPFAFLLLPFSPNAIFVSKRARACRTSREEK